MGKQSLKLFGTHAILSIFIFLFATMILAGVKSEFLDWAFSVMYLGLFWSVTWVNMVNAGNNDLKRERFAPQKGFMIGLFVQIPALITYVVALANSDALWAWIPRLLLRGWFSPYMKFTELANWQEGWWIAFLLLYIAAVGAGYLFGKKRREKTLQIIAERERMRGELSKRDSE